MPCILVPSFFMNFRRRDLGFKIWGNYLSLMLGFVILVLLKNKKLGLLAEKFRLLLRMGFNKKLKNLYQQ